MVRRVKSGNLEHKTRSRNSTKRESRSLDSLIGLQSYDSYTKNGFGAPDLIDRSDKMEVRFLNQVDLSKCKNNKIQVRILNMQRTRAIDYSSEKEERREFLVYMCDWLANQWLGNTIAVRSAYRR